MESLAIRVIQREGATAEEIIKDAHALAIRIKCGVAVSVLKYQGVTKPMTDIAWLLKQIKNA